MSDLGFQLVRLAVTGPDVADAEIRFNSGLNVISGPSDTGKTFILQCIDFMLGGRGRPKDIPEARGYDSVILEIRSNNDGVQMTLQRALAGGEFTLSVDGKDDRTLGNRHSGENQDTLSYTLLKLANLADRRIRKNQRGVTQSLSFRNLVHLIVVSEVDVISVRSPIETGQHTTRTSERAVFRLLLSGIDDSAVVAVEHRRLSRARTDAKVEVLDVLAEKTRKEIGELDLHDGLPELRNQLEHLDAVYAQAAEELSVVQGTLADAEERRRATWQQLRKVESRIEILTELETRFELLHKQYQSDLRRLNAIAETGVRLAEMGMEWCPICGALAEHHNQEHRPDDLDPGLVAEACAAEAQKIRSLLDDLDITRQDVREESAALSEKKVDRDSALREAGIEIRDQLKPRARDVLKLLRDYQTRQSMVSRTVQLLEQLHEFEAMIADVNDDSKHAVDPIEGKNVAARDVEEFCKAVQARLAAWNFPNLDRVTFGETDWDVVISGTRRANHGKGVRAITHAAFTLGLFKYCVDGDLPHPGFVVIDSPLVVYREPDKDEAGFSPDVKESFFKDLAANFGDEQLIILENDDPPAELAQWGVVNVVKFTGSTIGRRGFIPDRAVD